MSTVQLAGGSNIGGVILGSFGTYQRASDGTFTVDSRDAPALIAAGLSYVTSQGGQFTITNALAAAAGQIVASVALSNIGLTIANQPDVMRQVMFRVDPGTAALTAGTVSVAYVGNDGQLATESISLVTGASILLTKFVSKGVAHINTAIVSAVAGGASPAIEASTTDYLAVQTAPGAADLVLPLCLTDGTKETATVSTSSVGCFAPNTAPNGTHDYTVNYNFVSSH